MSKLIITEMDIKGKRCQISAVSQENRIVELRLAPQGRQSLLGSIYVGQVENIASNIQAAFVQTAPGQRCYFPLSESGQVIRAAGGRKDGPLRPGDEILVQVNRDAMKGKLPAVTANLNFTGKYLVLTTGDKKFGISNKLSEKDRERLMEWLKEEAWDKERGYGIIVRTNAADVEKEEILKELSLLKKRLRRVTQDGRSRTCFSLLYEPEPFYIEALRDAYARDLEEVVTDIPGFYDRICSYLSEISPQEQGKLKLYQDKLLPLYKLYRLENAIEMAEREKIWLNSGGFLVIQQTEAFVSIDVNSGKYVTKKKAEETYRKINLEAAREIALQLRLRNLSGIILIDFINMENPDHNDELFHVLQKLLRSDPVRARAIDITPLNILEMTRKKVRRPLLEELREL